MERRSNITLIGMPGAGKSTLGVLLAKKTSRDFVDTDLLIQIRESKSLQRIIDESDYLHLRKIEEEILLDINYTGYVIATGGSAVYSDKGMVNLKRLGPVIYLDVSLSELHRRINDYDQRGIACRKGQSFEELYEERTLLYKNYADSIIACDGKSPDEIIEEIICRLSCSS